jgi:hypothetical protein
MAVSRDHLRYLGLATLGSLPWVAGPLLLLGALAMPNPTVEERLLELGFADLLDEEDEGDERVIDLPALFSQLQPLSDHEAPEGEPTPPSATPELPPVPHPSETAGSAGAAPELAVAASEGAPAAAVGGEGDGSVWGPLPGNGRSGARTSKGRRPRSCDKPNPNIRTGADGLLEIDRSLVDHYTENLNSFMTLGYSRPYDEGQVHGWYISGFGCGSPVAKAGFKRGDVVLSVNGRKTRTWVGVFMLYQKLKNRDDFVVELVRGGEPVTLRFRVVPG